MNALIPPPLTGEFVEKYHFSGHPEWTLDHIQNDGYGILPVQRILVRRYIYFLWTKANVNGDSGAGVQQASYAYSATIRGLLGNIQKFSLPIDYCSPGWPTLSLPLVRTYDPFTMASASAPVSSEVNVVRFPNSIAIAVGGGNLPLEGMNANAYTGYPGGLPAVGGQLTREGNSAYTAKVISPIITCVEIDTLQLEVSHFEAPAVGVDGNSVRNWFYFACRSEHPL